MCRAVYAVVVAADSEVARLRRAAGLEVQVVATASRLEDATSDPAADVLIVHHAATEGAPPDGPALVVVGDGAPEWADHVVPDDENLNDTLPGAITRALIARRGR